MFSKQKIALFACICFSSLSMMAQTMMFGDTTRVGTPYSKDPHVITFKGHYLMYYSIPPVKWASTSGWEIGIAQSDNLTNWKPVGEIAPAADYEAKGLCAPCALVREDTVHLFYQTYGNAKKDAICHAWSVDGIHFNRDASNPIFSPKPGWNCGRAIDAEVVYSYGKYFLYYASRTPDYKTQIVGVATAPAHTSFGRNSWTEACDSSILYPQLPWEGECVEGPSVLVVGKKMYMFYAGAYNNWPQQIGVAVSEDGLRWKRVSDKPFLANGKPGSWNSSESGHPHIFRCPKGKTFLFYQGNNDMGKSWLLSNFQVFWNKKGPYLKK